MKQILAITVAMLSGGSMAKAQDATASPSPSASPVASQTSTTATAESVVVTSQELDISREQIVPSLGATRYTVGPDRLGDQAQGENAVQSDYSAVSWSGSGFIWSATRPRRARKPSIPHQ